MLRPSTPLQDRIEAWQRSRCCGECTFHSLDHAALVMHRVYCSRFGELMREVLVAQVRLYGEELGA